MQINFYTQPKLINGKDFCLLDKIKDISKESSIKYTNIWMIWGICKENGFDLLKETIDRFIAHKTKVNIVAGIDVKSMSYSLLDKLFKMEANVRVYDNSSTDVSLHTGFYIFEASKQVAKVLVTVPNLSDGCLTTNKSLVTEVIYELTNKEDVQQYINFKKSVFEYIFPSEDVFPELTEELAIKLADQKQQSSSFVADEDKIPTISELKKAKIKKALDDSPQSGKVDVDIDDMDIQIDMIDDEQK